MHNKLSNLNNIQLPLSHKEAEYQPKSKKTKHN